MSAPAPRQGGNATRGRDSLQGWGFVFVLGLPVIPFRGVRLLAVALFP